MEVLDRDLAGSSEEELRKVTVKAQCNPCVDSTDIDNWKTLHCDECLTSDLDMDQSEGYMKSIKDTHVAKRSEKELELMSKNSHLEKSSSILIAYTVWSRKRGAGKEIMRKLLEHIIKNMDNIKQVVTLSPLTPMATHYHIRNGAKLISINSDTQNFEYELKK